MALPQRILLLCLLWSIFLSVASPAEADSREDKPLPIPPELQGLWAQEGHCNDSRQQLHVGKWSLQFGTQRPIRSFYVAPAFTAPYGGVAPDPGDPAFTWGTHGLTYNREKGILYEFGNDSGPEQIYYRCPPWAPPE